MITIIDTSVIKNVIIFSPNIKAELINHPEYFKHYFLNNILNIKRNFSCNINNKLVLAIDKKKTFDVNDKKVYGYWRSSYYEKNIDKMSPHNRFSCYKDGRKRPDDGLDWEKLEKYYWECIELIKNYSDFQVIKVAGVEADDILAILAQRIKDNITMITIDKDLKQVISDKVKYYNFRTKKYDSDKLSEAENLLFYLKGDSGDGICSVKKNYRWKSNLAKKTLQEIFKEFPEENLEERLSINKKLMDLSVNNIPKSIQKAIINEYKKEQGKYHQLKLQIELKKMGVDNMTSGVESIIGRSDEFKLTKYSVDSGITKKHNNDMKKITAIRNKFL